MVSRWRGDRHGASTMGCIFSLLILVAGLYYGINIGQVYWRYYQLMDEMRIDARLAPSITDDVIRHRLNAKVTEIFGSDFDIPFKITRAGTQSRSIVIQAEYRDSVSLLLVQRGFDLKPRVEERL